MAANSETTDVSDSKRVVPLNTWVLISNFKLAYNLLRRPDGTFNRHLAEFLDRKVPSNVNPVDGVFSFDVIIDRPTGLLTRIYRPGPVRPGPAQEEEEEEEQQQQQRRQRQRRHQVSSSFDQVLLWEKPVSSSESEIVPVIIFFHGGSFAHSSANSAIYDTLCRRLVSICGGAVVVSVNYRRAPENRYPCAYDDGWKALEWVHSRTWLRSKKDSRVHIYLAGDSSGGNIVHNVSMKAAADEDRQINILGNVLLNPMFGGEDRTDSEKRLDGKYFVTLQDRDWYWKAFLPQGENRDHPACNPFGPRGRTLQGLKFPKSLVVVAGLDLVQDWQLAYAKGLEKAGQHVKLLYLEKATIGFYLLPNNDHFYTVMDEIRNFVRSPSSSSTTTTNAAATTTTTTTTAP